MKFLEAFNILDTRDGIGIQRTIDQIGYIVKINSRYKVILKHDQPTHFLNDMDYRLTPEDKDAEDWIVIDTATFKEIKFITLEHQYTLEYQLQFTNTTIQSHCMEKDGNLIYFYISEVSSKFAEATDTGKLQLSSIVYDISLKKTVKSRWYNLTNVYFDFLNKQFYTLEN